MDQSEQLQTLLTRQAVIGQRIDEINDRTSTLLEKHHLALFGDGDKILGLLVRTHDLESMFAIAKWIIIVGGGLVVTNAAQFFLNLYRGIHL